MWVQSIIQEFIPGMRLLILVAQSLNGNLVGLAGGIIFFLGLSPSSTSIRIRRGTALMSIQWCLLYNRMRQLKNRRFGMLFKAESVLVLIQRCIHLPLIGDISNGLIHCN